MTAFVSYRAGRQKSAKRAIQASNERWYARPGIKALSYVPETKDMTIWDGWAVEWGLHHWFVCQIAGWRAKQLIGTRLMVLKKTPDGGWKCFRGMGGPTFTAPLAGQVDQVPAASGGHIAGGSAGTSPLSRSSASWTSPPRCREILWR